MMTFDKIEVYNVGYSVIEQLINDNFFPEKRDYELLDSEEESNSHKLYEVTKELKYKWDKEWIKKFLEGDTKNNLRCGLLELCRRDLIPEGNYLIDLSW